MPFVVITGTYHLCGTRAGKPSGFQPDGDSMQFKPNDPSLLDRLDRVDQKYRLTAIGSTQLRFEGIDSLELHFQGTHQPRPLADRERDYLTGLLGMNPVAYKPPDDLTVQAPAAIDGIKGYIVSRSLEAHGRPVSFAYVGTPLARNGSEIVLKSSLLRKSLNYRSLASGNSYPLFYDTLFADLRDTLTAAAIRARNASRGLWREDLSMTVPRRETNPTLRRTRSSSRSCSDDLRATSRPARPGSADSCPGSVRTRSRCSI
jgi:hypothetical protein